MGREWKPGDVAVHEELGERLIRHLPTARDERWVWTGVAREGFDFRAADDFGPLRPLVVIDPEDEATVERLRDYLDTECDWFGMHEDNTIEQLQGALRSLLAPPEPPKPPEPQGLGAVVEDTNGRVYIRTADSDCRKPWSYANNYSDHEWSDVAAVRVLSEGVVS